MSLSYLITGTNRGIGLGLVEHLLKEPNTVIFAGVRSTEKTNNTKKLYELSEAHPDRVYILQIRSGVEEDAYAAAKIVKEKFGRLDVLIANAAISPLIGTMAETTIENWRELLDVNFLGIVMLYQAFLPLLTSPRPAGIPPAKFVPISTGGASSVVMPQLFASHPSGGYFVSKSILGLFGIKVHLENEKTGLVSFILSPGWVQTDMGNAGAKAAGLEEAPTTIEQSATGIISVIKNATREATGGHFMSFDGTEYPY